MTDRLKGVTVAFERDIREDDAELIINAIRMIKGVAGVKDIKSTGYDYINREQIRHEIVEKIYAMAKEI